MTELVAKPVLKNKYWIVESNGNKIGTIQATEDGGVVYVHDHAREKFASVKMLSHTYNLKFDSAKKLTANKKTNDIYGVPASGRFYNVLWNLKHKLPIFTKTKKSKSFYCAGYYAVKLSTGWTVTFCPKLITLNRYEFQGPFVNEDAPKKIVETLNG